MIQITFDYSLDVAGSDFFDPVTNPGARELLQLVADDVTARFADDLAAITPGGDDKWTAKTTNPDTGDDHDVVDLSVAANELVVFVGARQLGSTLGIGGPGGLSAEGSQAFVENVIGRGEAGVDTDGADPDTSTDFGPWGGALTFDIDTNWHFGESIDGLAANAFDFVSVAQHEIFHLLGFGTASSFDNLVDTGNDTFTGAEAMRVHDAGGAVPLDADGAHFAEGLTDNGQEAALDPTVPQGERKLVTELDFAVLDDVGWEVSAPVSINLALLSGADGFRIDGAVAGDLSGHSVSGAGDVNGDGFADVIIGAHGATPDGLLSGASYVVLGSGGGFGADFDLAGIDGSDGFRLDGAAGERSAISVRGAGDVNGDGFADVIVGADNRDSNTGAAFVVFGDGGPFGADLDLDSLDGSDGFRLDGETTGDLAGFAVSGAGDVNGDGVSDLLVGAYGADGEAGRSYLVFGSSAGFAASLDLGALDGSDGFRLEGETAGDFSGFAVSDAGDVNGDGFDDLLVGAYQANGGAGYGYVVFGSGAAFGQTFDLGAVDGANGFRIDGTDGGDYGGFSLRGAGDVNGDGLADVIVGADGGDAGANDAGESYVVFGATGGFAANFALSSVDGSNGFRIDGVAAGDRSGYSVSGAGDVNGDGFDDLLIGASRADPGGDLSAGESYVVFGTDAGFGTSFSLASIDGENGFRLEGVDAGDYSGVSVSGAGDVNGDGFDDLLIGADNGDPGGAADAGETYLIFGRDFRGEADFLGTDGADTFAGTGDDDILIGAQGDDDLDGGAGADALSGGAGDDVLAGGAGADALHGGTGTDTADFSAAPAGVSVNLFLGKAAEDGHGSNDRLSEIEHVIGSGFDDVLAGDALANVIDGGGGNDLLIAGQGAGDDDYDGGADVDTLDFGSATQPVTANLATGTATGAETGTDTITEVENLAGGAGDDVLTGDGADNEIEGRDGDDVIDGGGGANDTALFSGTADDYTVTFDGVDTFTFEGLDGTDSVKNVEFASFGGGAAVAIEELAGAEGGYFDFNGNGTDDFLMNNPTNNKHLIFEGSDLALTDVDFRVFNLVALGDFDGDGGDDLVFQNPTNSKHLAVDGVDQSVTDVDFRVFDLLSIGNYDGDASDDFVFQNPTNSKHLVVDGVDQSVTDVDFRVFDLIGSGNFDGDASEDLLFRNPTNGKHLIVDGEDQGITDIDFRVFDFLGVGDFTGDGFDDILFQNPTNSKHLIMDGSDQSANVIDFRTLNFTGVGNFDGDASEDILFRNPGNGKHLVIDGEDQSLTDVDFRTFDYLTDGNFDGDGSDDFLFQNPTNDKHLVVDGEDLSITDIDLRVFDFISVQTDIGFDVV